ncbi:hypothetical protein EV652_107421 [Kribbella steppae]|uniref:Uncharacterized protein n=1 Tax=Kribbella steppae TaxID=2512223 RepID=A0A4V2RZI8_9ACTN|nr:hypothetical protein EV652_107421 [Kribbella steppae]
MDQQPRGGWCGGTPRATTGTVDAVELAAAHGGVGPEGTGLCVGRGLRGVPLPRRSAVCRRTDQRRVRTCSPRLLRGPDARRHARHGDQSGRQAHHGGTRDSPSARAAGHPGPASDPGGHPGHGVGDQRRLPLRGRSRPACRQSRCGRVRRSRDRTRQRRRRAPVGSAEPHTAVVGSSRPADRRTGSRTACGVVRDQPGRTRGRDGSRGYGRGTALRGVLPGRRHSHAAVPAHRGEHLDQHGQQPRQLGRSGTRRAGDRPDHSVTRVPGGRRTACARRRDRRAVRRPTGAQWWRRPGGRWGPGLRGGRRRRSCSARAPRGRCRRGGADCGRGPSR